MTVSRVQTQLKGRMLEIVSGRSGLSRVDVDKYRAKCAADGFELPPLPVGLIRRWRASRPREAVGTALKARIEKLLTIKTGKGCGCKTLAADMDSWGVAGCEQRREMIVGHLVGNREILAESLKVSGHLGHAAGMAVRLLPEAMLRAGASWLLDQAIAEVRRQPKPIKQARPVNPHPSSKIVMSITPLQAKLKAASDVAPKPVADPFTGTPVVHFGVHLWPVKGLWQWHVDLWNEIAERINGKCIVGVVTDAATDSLETVRNALSNRFELFEIPNTPQGENPTFRCLQTKIPSGQNDVLLYCHGKGVRAHTASSESVRIWTQMMYEGVIFNHDRVIQKLGEGYKTFGSFRTFGNIPLTPRNQWHYSGTFFAVRAKYLADRAVKGGYGGVEAWPGDHFAVADSWCEFTNGPGFKAGYDIDAMYPAIVDAQMQWEVDRIGGPRCEQHLRELQWFLHHLNPHDRVLVIGSKHGGLEHQIKNHFNTIETLSVDIAPQADNLQPMIVGSSMDHAVQAEILKRGPFDVVFIDGDHTYQGVAEDWSFASQVLDPRLIAFHDIADAVKHRREGCEVDRLWAEIKATHRTDEKIVGCGWGGIGIVHL